MEILPFMTTNSPKQRRQDNSEDFLPVIFYDYTSIYRTQKLILAVLPWQVNYLMSKYQDRSPHCFKMCAHGRTRPYSISMVFSCFTWKKRAIRQVSSATNFYQWREARARSREMISELAAVMVLSLLLAFDKRSTGITCLLVFILFHNLYTIVFLFIVA